MGRKIFINYRRELSQKDAQLLEGVLRGRFGASRVFLDTSGVEGGKHWLHTLEEQVDASAAMVVLIAEGWATVTDRTGARRLDNPDDVVRSEIARAFSRKIPVLPVLVDGASIPDKSEIPGDLAELPFLQAMLLRSESFNDDAVKIAGRLKILIAEIHQPQTLIWSVGAVALAVLLAGIAVGPMALTQLGLSTPKLDWPDKFNYYPAFRAAERIEGKQKKAVITAGKTKLFNGETSEAGKEAGLMDVFFILERGGSGKRTPVATEPNKTSPDGWLDQGAYAEWNTDQMISFAPQGGRQLAEVFDSSKCAIDFSRSGKSSCAPLGAEPDLQATRVEYKTLVPVFKSEADRTSVTYEGGFVRVTPGQVTGATTGYDVVLAIDSTKGMQKWFKPILDGLADFVSQLQADKTQGEVRESLRIGLLFYQDRKVGTECQLDFITQWRVPLPESAGVETIEQVKNALAAEHQASCGSDERNEAVFDAINRAVLDPAWKDGTFRVVAVIGDADPHSDTSYTHYEKKNPLHLTTEGIQKLADERNVRFLMLRILNQGEDATEFEPLALQRREDMKGRFAKIPADLQTMRQTLYQTLWAEWTEIVKPAMALTASKTPQGKSCTKAEFAANRCGGSVSVSDYPYPIILNMLPTASAAAGDQSFSRGWVSEKVLDKTAVEQYVFMKSSAVKELIGYMEIIEGNLEEGSTSGAEAFIDALRKSLASQLKVKPEEIFVPGEPLSSLLKKKNVLPFETGVLKFTAEEINQWKPEDYKRVIAILKERNTLLREYTQVAGNVRQFGSVRYFYVPQTIFP